MMINSRKFLITEKRNKNLLYSLAKATARHPQLQFDLVARLLIIRYIDM